MIAKDVVFLAQTDTTVGFLSYNKNKLCSIKKRDSQKPFLYICNRLSLVKTIARIPNKYKNNIRRSKKSTFIHHNTHSTRLSFDKRHNRLLDKYTDKKPLFSTSANLSGFSFDSNFAILNCDVIVYQSVSFQECQASQLYKINNKTIKKISR